jgi:hypothetical protein
MTLRLKTVLVSATVTAFLLSGCKTSTSNSSSAAEANSTKYKGFIGFYHPYKGTVFGTPSVPEGTDVLDAIPMGDVVFSNDPKYGLYEFDEGMRRHCGNLANFGEKPIDVNRIYGFIFPPSENGKVNEPQNKNLWKPESRRGMIQTAKRFSELSKVCPQIAGLVIDDFYDNYPSKVSAKDLRDIVAAAKGKTVDANGKVDHDSPATTPHLKMYLVHYHDDHERPDATINELFDGVSLWLHFQNTSYKTLNDQIKKVASIYPGKEINVGIYFKITNSGRASVESIHKMLLDSIDAFDQEKINGVWLFSGHWVVREFAHRSEYAMSQEQWSALDLPSFLTSNYYRYLAQANGRVVGRDGNPIINAKVTVTKPDNKIKEVATKATDRTGHFSFGSWTSKNCEDKVKFKIQVEFKTWSTTKDVELSCGDNLNLGDISI